MTTWIFCKIHIFWEGHKNLSKSSTNFWLQYIQSKVSGRFRKILWPSQNTWTLNEVSIDILTFIHSRASSRVQRSIFRAARTYFVKTRRYIDSKFAIVKYALQDLMQTLKREITLKQIKAKVQEKKDNGGFHLHLFYLFIYKLYNRPDSVQIFHFISFHNM